MWQRFLVHMINLLNNNQAFLIFTFMFKLKWKLYYLSDMKNRTLFLKIIFQFMLILGKHQLSFCGSIQRNAIHALVSSSLQNIFHSFLSWFFLDAGFQTAFEVTFWVCIWAEHYLSRLSSALFVRFLSLCQPPLLTWSQCSP